MSGDESTSTFWRSKGYWIIAGVATALYAWAAPRFPVGSLGDDARDILAARSLLHFHYVNLALPQHPPLNFPLPGFPALMAPFVALLFSHVEALKVVPVAMVLASVGVLGSLVRPWLSPRRAWLVVALFALNPSTVAAAGRVISDGFYVLLLLVALRLLRLDVERPSMVTRWALALACAWAALVRPEGFLLTVAIAIAAAGIGRRPLALFVTIGSLGLSALWVIRNLALTGAANGYMPLWADRWTGSADGVTIIGQQISTLVWSVGLGVPWTSSWAAPVALVCIAPIALALLSQVISLPSDRASNACLGAALLYGLSHLVLHVLWGAADPHYLWPLWPIVLLILGVSWPGGERRFRVAGAALITLATISYARQDVDALLPSSRQTFPPPSFETIMRHLPPKAFVLTPNASEFTLYTGRCAMALIYAADANAFRYRLGQAGITHVFLTPVDFFYVPTRTARDPATLWSRYSAWISSDPHTYGKILDTPDRALFAVATDPDFQKAYSDYLDASDDFHASHWDRGFLRLDQSLKRWPMPEAMNAYAAAALLSNSHLDEARVHLMTALARRPDYSVAMVNLARVFERMNRRSDARRWYRQADATVSRTGDGAYLIPAIRAGLGSGSPSAQ